MREPVRKHGVMIAGENPMIVLYAAGSDEIVAIASVWTSAWSPAGTGRVLIIWIDPAAGGPGEDAPVGIFTDNADLADYVWEHFYRDYAPIHGRGVEDRPAVPAQFLEVSGGERFHRISCTAGATMIELEWRHVLDQVEVTTFPTGFECSVIAAPCAEADIMINGTLVRGEVRHPIGWFGSSAILAFAETWRAL